MLTECGYARARPTCFSPVAMDGGDAERRIVCSFLKRVLSSRPSLRRFRYERHSSEFPPCSPSVTRSVLFPRPAALRCSASSPSGLGFQQQISRAKNTLGNFLPEPPQKAHLGLGSGAHSPPQHTQIACRGAPVLASLRARVSRVKSGQNQHGGNHHGTLRISYVELGRFYSARFAAPPLVSGRSTPQM